MSLRVQTKWEMAEAWRSPFLAYALGTIVFLTYVLTSAYGLYRVEYFSRIAFVIMPLAFGLLVGSRHSRESEAAFRRLLAAMPLHPSTPFLARVLGGLSLLAAYLVLVLPLVVLHGVTFHGRIPLLLAGMLGALLLGACVIALSLLVSAKARRRPAFAQLLAFGALFGGLSAVAILGTGSLATDALLNLLPTVAASKAADGFLDTLAPALPALLVLALLAALALVAAHATWVGWTRGGRAAALVLALGAVAASAGLAAATHFEPYSNLTSVYGGYRARLAVDGVELAPGAELPIDETMRVSLVVDDPQASPMAGPTTLLLSGTSVFVEPALIELPPGATRYEVPVTVRLEPNVSALREAYVLYVLWTQDGGSQKGGTFLMHGSVEGFQEPIRWSAMVAAIPLLLGGVRARLIEPKRSLTRIRHVSS